MYVCMYVCYFAQTMLNFHFNAAFDIHKKYKIVKIYVLIFLLKTNHLKNHLHF